MMKVLTRIRQLKGKFIPERKKLFSNASRQPRFMKASGAVKKALFLSEERIIYWTVGTNFWLIGDFSFEYQILRARFWLPKKSLKIKKTFKKFFHILDSQTMEWSEWFRCKSDFLKIFLIEQSQYNTTEPETESSPSVNGGQPLTTISPPLPHPHSYDSMELFVSAQERILNFGITWV